MGKELVEDLYESSDSKDKYSQKCKKPCPPHECCLSCQHYWDAMRRQGYWEDENGWTEKAMKEITK